MSSRLLEEKLPDRGQLSKNPKIAQECPNSPGVMAAQAGEEVSRRGSCGVAGPGLEGQWGRQCQHFCVHHHSPCDSVVIRARWLGRWTVKKLLWSLR